MLKFSNLSSYSIILIILFLTSGCGGGKSEDPPKSEFELVTSQVIDNSGGSITSEEFELQVPDGAFNTEYQLKLYKLQTEDPFGTNAITPRFLVEGLPKDFAKPLQLKIRLQSEPENSEVYFAVSDTVPVYGGGEGETTKSHAFLNAMKVDDFLVAELKAFESNAPLLSTKRADMRADTDQVISFDVGGVKLRTYSSEAGHVKLIDPQNFLSSENPLYLKGANIAQLLQDMELALNKVKSLGFKLASDGDNSSSGRDFAASPLKITLVESTKSDMDFDFVRSDHSFFWSNDAYLELAIKAEPSNLEKLAYHYVLLTVLDLYDPVRDREILPAHTWLNESVATWFVRYSLGYEKTYDYYLGDLVDNFYLYALTFSGLMKGVSQNLPIDHGYSKANMVRYLVERYGVDILSDIYEQIASGKHHLEAMIQNTNEPGIWLREFYSNYFTGTYFSQAGTDHYWSKQRLLSSNYFIFGSTDTSITQTYDVDDLSARIVRITRSDPTITQFKISTDAAEGIKLSVFTHSQEGRLPDSWRVNRLLGEGVNEVTVDLVESITDVLVMITNDQFKKSYNNIISVPLTVEAKRSGLDFPITYEGQGTLSITYHWVNLEEVNFTCNSKTDYTLKLWRDGTVSMSYLKNIALNVDFDTGLSCGTPVFGGGPGPTPGTGTHNFLNSFWFERPTSGCGLLELKSQVDGTFDKDMLSGKGKYYECSNIGDVGNPQWVKSVTYEFDFKKLLAQ